GDDPLSIQAQVGFPADRPARDFFGDPDLLLGAVHATRGGIVRLPSDRLDRERVRRVLARAAVSVLLVAPVLDGDELLGAIVLGSPTEAPTADHESFVAAIASQLGHLL